MSFRFGGRYRARTCDLPHVKQPRRFFLIIFAIYNLFLFISLAFRHASAAEIPLAPPLSVAGCVVKVMNYLLLKKLIDADHSQGTLLIGINARWGKVAVSHSAHDPGCSNGPDTVQGPRRAQALIRKGHLL